MYVFVNKNRDHNNKIKRRVLLSTSPPLTIGIISGGISALVSRGVIVAVMGGVRWLASNLLHGVNAGSHQVGAKVKQPDLGVGHVGDGVDGVKDGVLGLVACQPGQQTPGSKASKRSQEWRILE